MESKKQVKKVLSASLSAILILGSSCSHMAFAAPGDDDDTKKPNSKPATESTIKKPASSVGLVSPGLVRQRAAIFSAQNPDTNQQNATAKPAPSAKPVSTGAAKQRPVLHLERKSDTKQNVLATNPIDPRLAKQRPVIRLTQKSDANQQNATAKPAPSAKPSVFIGPNPLAKPPISPVANPCDKSPFLSASNAQKSDANQQNATAKPAPSAKPVIEPGPSADQKPAEKEYTLPSRTVYIDNRPQRQPSYEPPFSFSVAAAAMNQAPLPIHKAPEITSKECVMEHMRRDLNKFVEKIKPIIEDMSCAVEWYELIREYITKLLKSIDCYISDNKASSYCSKEEFIIMSSSPQIIKEDLKFFYEVFLLKDIVDRCYGTERGSKKFTDFTFADFQPYLKSRDNLMKLYTNLITIMTQNKSNFKIYCCDPEDLLYRVKTFMGIIEDSVNGLYEKTFTECFVEPKGLHYWHH